MKLWENYHTPSTVDEATALLSQYSGEAQVIAGGTDLLLDIKQGNHPPVTALIDITHINDLRSISQSGGTLHIGAGVTHNEIVRSSVIAERATCLVESCGVVGGPQVRNVATLGGNVAHALPAGDGTISLVAFDAEVRVVQDGVQKWVPILDMYQGPGKSLIDSTRDILLGFRFDLCGEGEATAFKRIMRPQGVALPVLGCAVWMKLAADKETIEAARIVIGPVAPTPVRADAVEAVLLGKALDQAQIDAAVDTARETLKPRTSKYRATAAYRLEMIETLLRRTLPLAYKRARTGEATPEGVGTQ